MEIAGIAPSWELDPEPTVVGTYFHQPCGVCSLQAANLEFAQNCGNLGDMGNVIIKQPEDQWYLQIQMQNFSFVFVGTQKTNNM